MVSSTCELGSRKLCWSNAGIRALREEEARARDAGPAASANAIARYSSSCPLSTHSSLIKTRINVGLYQFQTNVEAPNTPNLRKIPAQSCTQCGAKTISPSPCVVYSIKAVLSELQATLHPEYLCERSRVRKQADLLLAVPSCVCPLRIMCSVAQAACSI